MSELESINKVLRETGRRRRLQRAVNGLAEGALVGVVLLIIALILYKLLPVPAWIISVSGGVAAICALIGAVRRGWRPESTVQTARWIDDQRQLKERISTAFEISQHQKATEWNSLVLSD